MKCWCYIVECNNGGLYVGITQDIENRVNQHISGKGALYTKMNGVCDILYAIQLPTRSHARRLEIWLKKQSRTKKFDFIRTNCSFSEVINNTGRKKTVISFYFPEPSINPAEPSGYVSHITFRHSILKGFKIIVLKEKCINFPSKLKI